VPILNDTFKNSVEVLVERIKITSDISVPVEAGSTGSGTSYILCKINESISNREGYTLSIKPGAIIINAKEAVGIFYAIQTIRQLLPPEIENTEAVPGIQLSVPCCEIEDEPRFVYRGFMLDVCRHFSPYESVKRYIDLLALHKYNTFHFHLTEGLHYIV
jgi:hexosaminidase